MSLLSVENLSVSFGAHRVVKGASFTIHPGEMVALVGESGSGKSMTAYALMQLLPESADCTGGIRFQGQELQGAGEAVMRSLRGNRIGMVFQEPMSALNPLHTIGRQIAEAIEIHRGRGSVAARVAELLEQVGLSHFKERLDAYPHQLSGGERQRVLIAMAIANRPDLLIADEPTTAVDVTIQAKILTLLKELQKEMNMAMLFITHDLTLVKRLADRVMVMREGEIVEQGKVAEVFAAPQHDYTRTLLGSAPKGQAAPLALDAATVISAENLSVKFPIKKGLLRRTKDYVRAVEGVNLSIRKGETLGVVGESGSGKTTLALALLKLLGSEGRIVFLGERIDALGIQRMRPHRANMQLVFQDPYGSLNPRMNVGQIIEEGVRVHLRGADATEREGRVARILEEVGLSASMRERYPHEFSGGQRQRIAIARAMVLNPCFVVLDEPTSALDLTVQAQLIALLKRFQAERGTGYLFISHDLRVVRAVAHRILVMQRGRMVEEADTQALFARPGEEYTRTLLRAAFLEDGEALDPGTHVNV